MTEITVRRAKPGDAARIAAFVNRGLREPIDDFAVIERFGNVGLMVAEQAGDLVGVLGWRAENLVVRVTDLLLLAAPDSIAAARALLSGMDRAADELQCEVALLLLPRPYNPRLVEFCRTLGYESQPVAALPSAWQEAAHESGVASDEMILVKQLREGRVSRPL